MSRLPITSAVLCICITSNAAAQVVDVSQSATANASQSQWQTVEENVYSQVSVAHQVANAALSASEVNEFHLALLGRIQGPCYSRHKRIIKVSYAGVIRDTGLHEIITESGLRIISHARLSGSLGDPVGWSIQLGEETICGIWLSLTRTVETVSECQLQNRVVFVNVSQLHGPPFDPMVPLRMNLEVPLDDFDGATTLQILELLGGPRSLLEKTDSDEVH
ncbi:MAG: hypothetical protein KF690_12045 [Bacteroidetes bacterium]|nr:hypothetical protein [Bacteroidota bacterium]